MNTRRSLSESMDGAMADHEILALYIESFQKMFSHPSPRVAREASEATRIFLNKKIVDHFTFEEQHLFPALLQADHNPEMPRLISALRKEHLQLLKEAKRLTTLLLQEDIAYNKPALLRKGMLNFFHSLERHASKENDLFPSLL